MKDNVTVVVEGARVTKTVEAMPQPGSDDVEVEAVVEVEDSEVLSLVVVVV